MTDGSNDPPSHRSGLIAVGLVLAIAGLFLLTFPMLGAADGVTADAHSSPAEEPTVSEPVERSNVDVAAQQSSDDGTTEFEATNTGGFISIGESSEDTINEFSFPEGGVKIEGVIDEEANTWESTNVEFPGIDAAVVEISIDVPDGFSGTFDRENGGVTATGEVVVSLEQSTGETSFQLDATTGTSGEMTGDANIGSDSGSLTLVDNEFVIEEGLNPLIDPQVGLPADQPGENRMELPLEIDFKESQDETAELPFDVELNEQASTLDVRDGEEIELVADMANTLDDRASQRIDLLVDGETGASTTVSLEAGASTTVSLSTQVSLADNGATVQIAGTNVTRTISVLPSPEVSVTPKKVHFQEAEVGQTLTETITVANQGDAPLEITRAELAQNAGDFSLSGPGQTTVQEGSSVEYDVSFSPQEGGTQATYFYLETNDPTGGTHVIALTSGDVDMEVTVDEDGSTRMQATVENASAGESTDVNLPEQTLSEDFETEQVSITPERSGTLSLDLKTSSGPLESTPDTREGFEINTSMVGNISAESNLANEDIAEAGFTITVDKDKLERWDSDPGNVSFYRYNEAQEAWEMRGGEVIDEGPNTATIRVIDDSFSEWTAAAARPEFDITNTEVSVQKATIDQELTIQVFVENIGGTEGTYTADLLLDGDVIDSQEALVAKGGEELFQFQQSFSEAGTYEVRVNDEFVSDVEVTEAETSDGNQSESDGDDQDDDAEDEGPGFGIGIALVAILAGLGAALSRRDS